MDITEGGSGVGCSSKVSRTVTRSLELVQHGLLLLIYMHSPFFVSLSLVEYTNISERTNMHSLKCADDSSTPLPTDTPLTHHLAVVDIAIEYWIILNQQYL